MGNQSSRAAMAAVHNEGREVSRLTYSEMRTRAERLRDEKIKKQVLKGLKTLQKKHGDDWVEKIDCETLDLSEGAQCVLGQVYGDFDLGVDSLHGEWDLEWAEKRGFYRDSGDYDDIDKAWHVVLCDK